MALITALFVIFLLGWLFIFWRIYLIRHNITLIKCINELYALWNKRRNLIEQKIIKISLTSSSEWLMLQKELFISFVNCKDRIKSEERITSYLKSPIYQQDFELLNMNRLIEQKTFLTQRLEIKYHQRLIRLGRLKKWIGLKKINFFN